MGIEAALLAMGASAGTAATVGTIASGLSTGFSVLSGVSSLMGGMQAKQESKVQAANAMADAAARGEENARVSAREAQFTQEEADNVRRRQKLAYLKSGVSLEGTPFLALDETRRRGRENVDEILRSGEAGSRAIYNEGRQQARSYKAAGRREFMNGLTNAGQSFGRLF